MNGVEIFSQALYENLGQSEVNAAQLYLKALLKYHRELVNDSSTIITFEEILDFEDIAPAVKVDEAPKRLEGLEDSDEEKEGHEEQKDSDDFVLV